MHTHTSTHIHTHSHTHTHTHRLEEMNDKRQGMIQRLKIAEKEKEGLEGKKVEAEMFLAKQVCWQCVGIFS